MSPRLCDSDPATPGAQSLKVRAGGGRGSAGSARRPGAAVQQPLRREASAAPYYPRAKSVTPSLGLPHASQGIRAAGRRPPFRTCAVGPGWWGGRPRWVPGAALKVLRRLPGCGAQQSLCLVAGYRVQARGIAPALPRQRLGLRRRALATRVRMGRYFLKDILVIQAFPLHNKASLRRSCS